MLKISHGRKGQEYEFYEAHLEKPNVNVVCQKSGEPWILFIVWRGKNAPVRTVGQYPAEHAEMAVEIASKTLSAYMK